MLFSWTIIPILFAERIGPCLAASKKGWTRTSDGQDCKGKICLPQDYKRFETPENITIYVYFGSQDEGRVNPIRKVDDREMTLSFDYTIWLFWKDPRINITGLTTMERLDEGAGKNIWIPELWTTNLKVSETKDFMGGKGSGTCGFTSKKKILFK